MDKRIIIIPDVHGRMFWKNMLDDIDSAYRIIFTGDYLDPYPHEGISPEDTIYNFLEILQVARKHSNVTLLLGNHDLEYFSRDICDCRCIKSHYSTIRQIFMENINLFNIATTDEINDRPFVFSHAGFIERWIDSHDEIFGDMDLLEAIDFLNKTLHEDWTKLTDCLSDVSGYRSYMGTPCGSVVWSDVREHVQFKDEHYDGITQIFGHTMLNGKAINIDNHSYCLDCSQIFYIDENGDVRYYNDDKIVEKTKLD